MTLEISFLSIIDILSIATAFMLGLLFLTSKSKNNKANIFLGLFLWSLTTEVLASFLDGQETEITIISTGLLTLPLLFLYVIKTLNYKFKSWYIVLILPFLFEFIEIIPEPLYYIFSIILLWYILKILNKHQQKLGDFYSYTENKTLSWIKTIIYIYLFFNIFWIVEELIGLQFEFIIEYFALTSSILTLVMIYWIGHNGFTQPEIFNATTFDTSKNEIPQSETEISEKDTVINDEDNEIEDQETTKLFHQLILKIKDKSLFLQKDITIRSLSRQLKISEKELSKLIKTQTKKNFYHFINQFRVEEFKRLLKTKKADELSLLGLSEEAGFSSKSTFYSVFKATEGITPKQYQDQLNKSE